MEKSMVYLAKSMQEKKPCKLLVLSFKRNKVKVNPT